MPKKKFKDRVAGKALLGALELVVDKTTGVDLGNKAEDLGEALKLQNLEIKKKLPPWAQPIPLKELVEIFEDGKVTKDEIGPLVSVLIRYGVMVAAAYGIYIAV